MDYFFICCISHFGELHAGTLIKEKLEIATKSTVSPEGLSEDERIVVLCVMCWIHSKQSAFP